MESQGQRLCITLVFHSFTERFNKEEIFCRERERDRERVLIPAVGPLISHFISLFFSNLMKSWP